MESEELFLEQFIQDGTAAHVLFVNRHGDEYIINHKVGEGFEIIYWEGKKRWRLKTCLSLNRAKKVCYNHFIANNNENYSR